MDVSQRIERRLEATLENLTATGCPPRLAEALKQSVFPGGARIRPKLTLAVAGACGGGLPEMADAAACAIELMHCASLVQDDLRCFDDAAIRRGQPAVHVAFDERLAILASDALIVGAFDVIAEVESADAGTRLALVRLLSAQVGSLGGITAGQAWESEDDIPLVEYHRAKTGSLFAAATQAGALAAGADRTAWLRTGERIGAAYQIADDLHDVLSQSSDLGKPVQVDALHDRPNAASSLGVDAACSKLRALIDEVVVTVPSCAGAARFIETVRHEALQFLPQEIARSAA